MLRPWTLPIQINTDSHKPIYQQVASSIIVEIERGRLKPDTALPGTRALAKLLHLNRNTVATAFEELIAQGWVVSEKSRGTFVARRLPRIIRNEAPTRPTDLSIGDRYARKQRGPQIVERLAPPRFSFTDEGPDPRVDSDDDFQEAFRRASKTQLGNGWNYCDPRGALSLRASLAEMLRTRRGLPAEPESILVTRGRQMALYLFAQASLERGSVVAVEQPGQRRVWETFRATGARVVGVPVDGDGLQVDALRRLSKVHPIRAVYVSPEHQYPTTVTLSAQRRRELLHWAEETGSVILEDDLDHEYQYGWSSNLSLASQDKNDSVIYIGSFSRLLMPGLNLGFIAASETQIRRMAQLRALIDRQGESAMEMSVSQLIRLGKLQRRIVRTKDIYRDRRDRLAALLRQYFGNSVRLRVPSGGGALWLQPDPVVNTQSWCATAAEMGIKCCCSSAYSLDEAPNGGLRLSFTTMRPEEMEQAVRLLAESYPGNARLSNVS
jgi:GntR family transcriptional regulator/MocR family aminotransferase